MSGDRSLGIGDLPGAGPVTGTDTLAICQSPTGCFASDLSVTLRGVSQSQLATYYQSTFAGVAPITYDSSGNIGLAIDSTLQVTAGQLGVAAPTEPPIVIPSAPLLGGNGTILGSVALGTNLSISGTFPNQTLNAAGITGGPFLALSGGTMTGPLTMSGSGGQGVFRTIYGGGINGMAVALGDPNTGFHRAQGTTPQAPVFLNIANASNVTTPVMTWDLVGNLSQLGVTLSMTNHAITFVLDPVDPQDAATKHYVDLVGGGGGIIVPNAPLLSGNGTDLGSVALGSNLSMAGGFPGQTLNVTGLLPLAGGTLVGPLTMAASQWIQLPTVGGVAGPALRLGEATTGFFRSGPGATADVYLNINGGAAATWGPPNTMCNLASDLSMTSHGIIALREPVNPQDAATKNYVDTRPGGGGGITGITAGAGITVTPDPVSPTVAVTAPLPIALGGTNGTTQATARTGLGLGNLSIQNSPLGTQFGGTQRTNTNLYDLLAGGGVGNALVAIANGAVGEVLHGGSPPSYGAVRLGLGTDVTGTLPVGNGGTGATTFAAGNLIGMGGANAFVGVPTPIAVGLGGTGATTLTPTGAVLLGSGTAAVRASQLATQTSDAAGLQLRTAGATPGSPYVDFYWASSGTIGSPGATQSGDNLGGVYAGGADSSGWSNGGECVVGFNAIGNWTPTSHPTEIVLGTTPSGATNAIPRLSVRQGMAMPPVADMGVGTINVPNGYYANSVGANSLAISWLAGIDPNNAVIVVAQRAMTLTNVTAVIRASNTGANVQIRRGSDNANMLPAVIDLGRPQGIYEHPPSITALAAGDYLYLATSGTFTTSVAHVTVAVA